MKILKSGTTNELISIALKLGGFHLTMSFVGCIGHLLQSSGLKEVLEPPIALPGWRAKKRRSAPPVRTVKSNAVSFTFFLYAPGAGPHILSGKGISRAIRAHILVSSAIYAHLREDKQAILAF